MSDHRLTDDEHKLLSVLATNARKSVEELAEECGWSTQKVRRVLTKLESDAIIWGYSTIFDGERCGLQHFILLLKRSSTNLSEAQRKQVLESRIEHEIKHPPIILENIQFLNGPYNVIVTFWAAHTADAKKFSNHLVARYREYFTDSLLLENVLAIRRQGQRNVRIKEKVDLLEFL